MRAAAIRGSRLASTAGFVYEWGRVNCVGLAP